ncbi:MAG: ABC transporter substrate-binding protein [Rhodoplanes sp.]|uniref:ABC transporter substrate-binding protein n=1 Tax=Rhodoplanes sp. TaxID=1968906 RepID=UPI0018179DF5|nr:ABC transporter substrate-binding protein [Rhodoplanes sp.]NVO13545.1 ABC transporter substrate-binding protein [Rhodoplanes sp.]
MSGRGRPGRPLSRRAALSGVAAVAATGFAPARTRAAPRRDRLTIAGMPATPTVLLARVLETGALAPYVEAPQLQVWRTLDELRAGVRSGAYDVVGLPTDAAAALFNGGAAIRLLDVVAWGLLYLVGRDASVTRIEDLAGRRITVAFRGEAPDLIVRLVLRRLGLDPDRDVSLDYVATPAETARRLLEGETDLAVVPEPLATAILLRSAASAAPVRRIADLTAVYGALTGRPRGLPKAGLAVSEALVETNPALVTTLHRASVAAASWVRAEPAAAARLGSEPLALPAAVIEGSLPFFRLDVVAAASVRTNLEQYFGELAAVAPDVLGGSLPPARFYWGDPA